MAPLAHSLPPASKHSLFMRGFGGQVNKEDIRNFFAKETSSEVTFDFCKTNIEHTKLYVALRFKTKELARNVYDRFDGKSILGSTIKMSWFRDLRIVRVGKERFFSPRSLYHSRNLQRLRASANPFYRKRPVSPKRFVSMKESSRIRSPSEEREKRKFYPMRRSESHSRSLRSPSPKRKNMSDYSPSRHRSSSSHGEERRSHEKSRSPHRSSHSHSRSRTPDRTLQHRSRTPEQKKSQSPSPKIILKNHPDADKKIPYTSGIYGKVGTFNDMHIKTEPQSPTCHTSGSSAVSTQPSHTVMPSSKDTDMRKMHYSCRVDDEGYRSSSYNSSSSSSRVVGVTNGMSEPSNYHARRDDSRGSCHSPNKWASPTPSTSSSTSSRPTFMNGDHLKSSLEANSEWTPQQLAILKAKKEEIERAYRQDCETFATVVKMLISKDPSLEEKLQYSLEENLKLIGQKSVEELKDTIESVRANRDKP
ncbi:periphilin-1-like [Ptychodera flava]|uniref:periphilin-1-like n=1 Tax=Ptychodera flava TaxID=63121 RepID=UPI00396A2ACA